MSPARSPHRDHRQRLTVETPEHVTLEFELAGLGSRMLAFVADMAVVVGLLFGLMLIVTWLGALANAWSLLFLSIVGFALYWGYFVVFEGIYDGRTPGKRWVGIRVVRDSGHPITLSDAAARNLIRVADALPPPFLLGLLLIALHPRAKRLGDLVAGTVVVRDRPVETSPAPARPEPAEAMMELGPPVLTDAEYRILTEFLDRAPTLEESVQHSFAARLATRFAERIDPSVGDRLTALRELQIGEQARRAGRLALSTGRGGKGPAAGAVAERLASTKGARWDEFGQLALQVSEDGIDRLGPDQLLDFASRYREVAADLARVRTYQARPMVIHRLERLVAAGHNAIYRSDRGSADRVRRFLFEECPAAIIEARRAVLLAFLAFAGPAAASYALLREKPALAAEVIPDVMLERAEAAAERRRAGHGYFEAEPGTRPLVATSIIANNVSVAFYCFAGGIFLGVGSLVMLGINGLEIGASTGHFANLGLFGYLWTFIAGHGLLELFAIWVAGAAGLLLGRAIVAPGRATRRDALVLAGRLAIRMIGCVVIFLLLAGLVEGFVSASGLSLGARLSVSVASAVFLVLFLANGARYRLRSETATASPASTSGSRRSVPPYRPV